MKAISRICQSREATGILAGLLIVCFWAWRWTLLKQPAWVFVIIVLLGCLSASIVARMATIRGMDAHSAVREGVWSALTCALVATSCYVWMIRVEGTAIPSMLGLAGGALSILPAMLWASVCAGVVALFLTKRERKEETSKDEQHPIQKHASISVRVLVAVFAVVSAAFAFIPSVPKAAQTGPSSSVSFTPPPPFSFSVSSELVTAKAPQWQYQTSRFIGEIRDQVFCLSADEQWISFLSPDGKIIRTLDLHSSAEKPRIAVPFPAERIALSPMADRLLVVSSRGIQKLSVHDLASQTVIALPMPKGKILPNGRMLWWKDTQVLTASADGGTFILDLDTLLVDRAADVPVWSGLLELERDRLTAPLCRTLVSTPRWKLTEDYSISSAELPEVIGTDHWPVEPLDCFSMTHPDHDFHLAVPQIGYTKGDLIAITRDGSKVIVVGRGLIHAHYFSAATTPPLRWKTVLPLARDGIPESLDPELALAEGRLRFVVYGALKNPLNNRVIGPDRSTVRALLTIAQWKGTEAELYLSRSFQPIHEGDIIADLSVWKDRQAELVPDGKPRRWWSVLPAPIGNSNDITQVAALEDMEKQSSAIRDNRQTKAEAEKQALLKAAAEKEAALQLERQEKEKERIRQSKAAMPNPMPAPPPPIAKVNAKPPENRIRDFVTEHHNKASKSDLPGYLADYGDPVDYFNNGLVNHKFLVQDVARYHALHTILEESIVGEVVVRGLPRGFTADYVLKSRVLINQTGQEMESRSEVSLIIIELPEGLRIVRQKASRKN